MGDERDHSKVDVVRKGAVDFAAMQAAAVREAEAAYDVFAKAIEGLPWPKLWREVRDEHEAAGKSMDEARTAYHAQPAVVAVNKSEARIFLADEFEEYGQNRAAYVERKRMAAFTAFAYVKDGQWVEKGSMGWFGMSDDKMTQDQWNVEFNKMVEALPDDALLTVVDCHI